jgi:cell division protein FtsB
MRVVYTRLLFWADGFALADVVGEVCAAALLKVDELTAQLAAANAELAAVRAAKEPA